MIKTDPESQELRVKLDDGGRIVTISLTGYDRERIARGYSVDQPRGARRQL